MSESFRQNYIPHNYAIPQVMPHAMPQTHSAFYPHRKIKHFQNIVATAQKSIRLIFLCWVDLNVEQITA